MIRTEPIGEDDATGADNTNTRWRGQGGPGFFIAYLKRVLHWCYGPGLADRFRYQCYEVPHARRINCCGFCGRFMDLSATHCVYCRPIQRHLVSGGETHPFFALIGKYVIALDYPHRAAAIDVVYNDMRLWQHGWEPCLGCHTLLRVTTERALVKKCMHIMGNAGITVLGCRKPWCSGLDGSHEMPLAILPCDDNACPMASHDNDGNNKRVRRE